MAMEFTEGIYNETLINIEDKCLTIANKVLIQLGMPAPTRAEIGLFDVDLRREQSYNISDLQFRGDLLLGCTRRNRETFLIRLILATVRSKNDIALALASSGIAATLLPGGRTAHSALKLPLNIQTIDTPTCNISKTSGMGKVLQKCKVIVWDECTMIHKKSLEALDRSLQDLRGNIQPFGDALILLAGDFRQTLPVISRSTPADEINACLKYSTLWRHVHILQLTTNMRVQLQNDRSAEVFSRQLLDIGNGQLSIDETRQISLPDNFCNLVTSKEELISKVFPNFHINYRNHNWLSERAVLAAKNKDVYQLNHFILSSIQSEKVIYKSIDTVVEADEVVNYPSEFLNSLDLPGMPPHVLKLKTGMPVIMLRNVNQPKLCNGTQLAVKKLMNNVVEATILTGPFKGEDVLIPRIPMIPTDTPFKFKRLQFPILLAFAITINKAQGQSLELCGLDLSVDCFSHGQLYVACSRVGKPDSLYIYANNGKTKNIVYPQVLQN
ncbi:ATP-dependent DNA helicase [Trichonephila clavipes]|nr:ATP-dependent DNA helicase [Trichonephila clavipes]